MNCLDEILEKEIIREEHAELLLQEEKVDAIDMFASDIDDVDDDIIDSIMDDEDDSTYADEDSMFNKNDIIDDFREV